MKKKMMKALRDLNAYVDNDRQNLCDRYEELKLSHNRQEKLLREAYASLTTFWRLCARDDRAIVFKDFYCVSEFLKSAERLHQRLEAELHYPYFRVKGNFK